MNFETHLKDADLVLTSEGNTDYQPSFGKATVGVAEAAKKFDVPAICMSGGLCEGSEQVLKDGMDCLMRILSSPMPLQSCMEKAAQLLENATSRLLGLRRIGMNFKIGKKVV